MKEETEKFLKEVIIIYVIMVSLIYISVKWLAKEQERENYIQNLETKLNIYEQSYDEYCVEDSIKQSDAYE